MAYQSIRGWNAGPKDKQLMVTSGAVAGLISGVVIAAVWMTYCAITGEGFLFPLQAIAATFMGVEALIGGTGTIILGALLHFAVAAGLGALFGAILPRDITPSATVGWGLAYGVAVWLVMTYVALPIFDPVMSARVAFWTGMWFVSHLAYGAVLGSTPAIARQMAVREVTTESYRRAA